jgi:hypothetical protein
MTRMSSSEPVAIDYVDSHARLREGDVEVVLCGLTAEIDDSAALVLSRDGVTVSAPAKVRTLGETREVRARTPRSGLVDGHWKITLAAGEGIVVDARLLVQGARPVVLLLGAAAPPSVVPARGDVAETLTSRQKAARVGGRALDRALSVLPEEQAARARERARSLARSVLR